MDKSLRRTIITHLVCVLGFLMMTIVLYRPHFFQKKQLAQHDVQQAAGTNKQLRDYRSNTGEEGLWNMYMFSGMPAYLTGADFSGDLLKYVYKGLILGMYHPAGISFLCFINFYLLLLAFGVRPWMAFAGAIAFGLNGFNIISVVAGHNSKIAAVAFMPAIIAGIHWAFNDKRWLGAGIVALALALQVHTNHMQIVYYSLLMTLVYGGFHLFYAIKDKKTKEFSLSLAFLVVAAFIAVVANFGKMWTIYEYGKVSIRGKSELSSDQTKSSGLDRDYAFQYSNGILEPLFLFVPNVFGGSSQQALSKNSSTAKALRQAGMDRIQVQNQLKAMPTYWGNQPYSAPYYAGSLVFFLFILAMFVLSGRQKTWLIVVMIMGIVFSWGSNFSAVNDLMFQFFPGFNKFRSVTFFIIIAIFAINLLGFLGLEELFRQLDQNTFKKVLKAALVGGGFLLVLIIAAGMLSMKGGSDARLPEWLIEAIRADRVSLLRGDAIRALALILAFGGLLWALIKEKLGIPVFIGVFILLVLTDIFGLSTRFLKADKFERRASENFHKPTEANLYVKKVASVGERVLNLQNPFNEARTSYFHESIGGYHGAKIRRYQDLISNCISSEMSVLIGQLREGKNGFNSTPVINMLNAKYLLAGNTRNAVLENQNALGPAWIVNDILTVSSPDEEIAAVCGMSPASEAVLDETRFEVPNLSSNGTGFLFLEEKTPNYLRYSADVNGEVLGVFSEIYYDKGWKAFVDDQEVSILRVNYVLRALPLTNGQHKVEFKFEPKSYQLGNVLTLIGSIGTLLLFFVGIATVFRK